MRTLTCAYAELVIDVGVAKPGEVQAQSGRADDEVRMESGPIALRACSQWAQISH